jgi:hypothetical protein
VVVDVAVRLQLDAQGPAVDTDVEQVGQVVVVGDGDHLGLAEADPDVKAVGDVQAGHSGRVDAAGGGRA